jgi:nitroreductase
MPETTPSTTTDLYEVMSSLRAVRRLRPDPIPADVLERVLQAAAWAPSGGNQQPWRVVVVTDPGKKAALADLYAPEWAKYTEMFKTRAAGAAEDEQAALMRTLAAGDHLAAHLGEAPVI